MAEKDISHVWRDASGRWTDTPGIGDDAPKDLEVSPGLTLERAEEIVGEMSEVNYQNLMDSDGYQYTASQWIEVLERDEYEGAIANADDWEWMFDTYDDEFVVKFLDDAKWDLDVDRTADIGTAIMNRAANHHDITNFLYDIRNSDKEVLKATLRADPEQWVQMLTYDGENSISQFFDTFYDEFKEVAEEENSVWTQELGQNVYDQVENYYGEVRHAPVPDYLEELFEPEIGGIKKSEFFAISPSDEVVRGDVYKHSLYQPEWENIDMAVDRADASMQAVFEKDYETPPARMEMQIEEWIQKNALSKPVAIVADPGDAAQIMKDGRWKTQQETEDSHGSYDPGYRMMAEQVGLGIEPVPLEDVEQLENVGEAMQQSLENAGYAPYIHGTHTPRPIYGYMDIEGSQQYVSAYGSVKFTFSDDVKNRTTFTVGDSLSQWGGFDSGLDMETVGTPITARRTKAAWDKKVAHLIDAVDRNMTRHPNIEYFEAQIHGGASVDDVVSIEFTDYMESGGQRSSAEIIDMAEARNIPWKPSRNWSARDTYQVASDSASSKMQRLAVQTYRNANQEDRKKADWMRDDPPKTSGQSLLQSAFDHWFGPLSNPRPRRESEAMLAKFDNPPEPVEDQPASFTVGRTVEEAFGPKKAAPEFGDKDISHVWRDARGRWVNTPGIGDDAPKPLDKREFLEPASELQEELFDIDEFDILGGLEAMTPFQRHAAAPAINAHIGNVLTTWGERIRKDIDDLPVHDRSVSDIMFGRNENFDGMPVIDIEADSDLWNELKRSVDALHATGNTEEYMRFRDYSDLLVPDHPDWEGSKSLLLPGDFAMSLLENDMVHYINEHEVVAYYLKTKERLTDLATEDHMPVKSALDRFMFQDLRTVLEEDSYDMETLPGIEREYTFSGFKEAVGNFQHYLYNNGQKPSMSEWAKLTLDFDEDAGEYYNAAVEWTGLPNTTTEFADMYLDAAVFERATSELDLGYHGGIPDGLAVWGAWERTLPIQASYDPFLREGQALGKELNGNVRVLEEIAFALEHQADQNNQFGGTSNFYGFDESYMKAPINAMLDNIHLDPENVDVQEHVNKINSIMQWSQNDQREYSEVNRLVEFEKTVGGGFYYDMQTGDKLIVTPEQAAMNKGMNEQFKRPYRRDGTYGQPEYDQPNNWEAGKQKGFIARAIQDETGFEYQESSDFVHQWAKTSNDDDLRALSIQVEAADMFDSPLSEWQQAKFDDKIRVREEAIHSGGQPIQKGLFHFEERYDAGMGQLEVDYGLTEADVLSAETVTADLKKFAEDNNLATLDVDKAVAEYNAMSLNEKVDRYIGDTLPMWDVRAKQDAVHNFPSKEQFMEDYRNSASIQMYENLPDDQKAMMDRHESEWDRATKPDARYRLIRMQSHDGTTRLYPDILSTQDVIQKQHGLMTNYEFRDMLQERSMMVTSDSRYVTRKTLMDDLGAYSAGALREKAELLNKHGGEIDVSSFPVLEKSEDKARTKIRSALTAMYDRTQKWLGDAGVTELRLFRGVTVTQDEWSSYTEGEAAQIDDNTLSSWTINEVQGRRFAKGTVGSHSQGVVLEAVIPAERIFSSARTGFGCLNEEEFVVIADPGRPWIKIKKKV